MRLGGRTIGEYRPSNKYSDPDTIVFSPDVFSKSERGQMNSIIHEFLHIPGTGIGDHKKNSKKSQEEFNRIIEERREKKSASGSVRDYLELENQKSVLSELNKWRQKK